MRITIKTLRTVCMFIAIPFLISSGCDKDKSRPCRNVQYSFSVTGKWVPEKEIYNLGDTIFFESNFPKQLTNILYPSNIIDYTNSIGISGGIGFGYMDTLNMQMQPAKNSFELIAIKGSFSNWTNNQNQGVNINYFEDDQFYHFKAAIICKAKGIFSFGVSDLYSSGIKGKDCTNAGFSLRISNGNKHLHLHKYALGVDTTDAVLLRTVYDFRVH